jgi:mono/diheme cytochrome c family protein
MRSVPPKEEVAVLKKSWLTRVFLIVPAVLLFAFIVGAQQTPPPAKPDEKAPPDAVQKQNPVKPTPESLAKAKKLYAIDCAMCHGDSGDGKGDMATDIKGVTDFTKPEVQSAHTDGEWFYIIRHGKGEMPPEGDRAKDDDVWGLVNYIRTFGKK